MLTDDHSVVREGLRLILQAEPEFEVVGEASDGFEALRTVERLRPDLLVLDLVMPGLPGLDVIKRVDRVSPSTKSLRSPCTRIRHTQR